MKIYKLAINTKMGRRSDDRALLRLLRVFNADFGFKLTKIGSEINYKVEKEIQDFFTLYHYIYMEKEGNCLNLKNEWGGQSTRP